MSLLDRYDASQRAPLGAYSALNRPTPAASQYKRQAALYGQAMRNLSRAARRGDARAALAAIDVSNQAMEDGFAPGGIQRSENMQAGAAGFQQSFEQRANDLENRRGILDRRLNEDPLTAPRAFNPREWDYAGGKSPVNPNATPGAGRGTPIGREQEMPSLYSTGRGDGSSPDDAMAAGSGNPSGKWVNVGGGPPVNPARRMSFAGEKSHGSDPLPWRPPVYPAPRRSFAEQEAEARKRSTAAGAFGRRGSWWNP